MTKVSKRKAAKPRTKVVKAWSRTGWAVTTARGRLYFDGPSYAIFDERIDAEGFAVRGDKVLRVLISIAPSKGKRR